MPSVGSGAPGGVPVTQSKLTNYDDLKAPGKGFNWDPHRTQDTYTEATDEDRTAFGLGVGVRNTLELEVPWGGKVASTQDGVTKEPSSLTWQLHPRVKPGTSQTPHSVRRGREDFAAGRIVGDRMDAWLERWPALPADRDDG